VHAKEQADPSHQYILAEAILDDRFMPEQYLSERIQRSEIQICAREQMFASLRNRVTGCTGQFIQKAGCASGLAAVVASCTTTEGSTLHDGLVRGAAA
jgi:hypothetical protein